MLALVMRETAELGMADLGCVTMAVTGSAPSTPEFFEQMHRMSELAGKANEATAHGQRNVATLVEAIEQLSTARTAEDIAAVVRSRARAISGADGITVVLRSDGHCL